MHVKSFFAILLAMQLSVGMAAPSAIGIASAKGNFRIDNAAIAGNGTLFDGVIVETQRATGQLELNNGTRLQLGINTRGKVFSDRLILEQGETQFRTGDQGKFGLEARTLRIIPADSTTVAHVSMVGASRVHVSALRGSLRVTNAGGVVVGALAAGSALEFEPQAGASAPSKLTGCVVSKDGRFFLTDETSGITVELRGAGLDKQAGNKVEIAGSQLPGVTPAEPNYNNAGQVVQVSALKTLSKKCSLPAGVAAAGAAAAGGAAAGGAAAGGAAAGAAAGAGAAAAGVSTAVVAGVVVAGAAAATTIGVVATNDDSISR
jgi:hypothetical protein